jgi:hypothetical protein
LIHIVLDLLFRLATSQINASDASTIRGVPFVLALVGVIIAQILASQVRILANIYTKTWNGTRDLASGHTVGREFVDIVSQAEDSGVQVKVTPSRPEIRNLLIVPENLVLSTQSWQTILGIAGEAFGWWARPHVARVRHPRAANEACVAAIAELPGVLGLVYSPCWLGAKGDLGDRRHNSSSIGKHNRDRVNCCNLSCDIATARVGFCDRSVTPG